jgi:hypothetical protein
VAVGRENVILAGRAFLAASLTETCTIQHPTGGSTSATTGAFTPTFATLYTGQSCKVGTSSPAGTELAGAHVVTLSPTITVPVEVVGIVEQDVITITTSALDPELVGRVYRVLGPVHRTWITRRQYEVVETTS